MSEVQLEFLTDDTVSLVEANGSPVFELVIEEQVTVAALQFGVDLEFEGPPFYPATGGGAGSYVHTQSVAAATWTVVHNLGTVRTPQVVLDSAPTEIVYTNVEIIDLNTIALTFDSPVTGKAYI